jgi:hypothetical protein
MGSLSPWQKLASRPLSLVLDSEEPVLDWRVRQECRLTASGAGPPATQRRWRRMELL